MPSWFAASLARTGGLCNCNAADLFLVWVPRIYYVSANLSGMEEAGSTAPCICSLNTGLAQLVRDNISTRAPRMGSGIRDQGSGIRGLGD